MSVQAASLNDKVRIVCISDTHNDDCTQSLPDGDLLVHAGDMTDDGTMEELRVAYEWIAALPHKIKLVIAGNHDVGLDPDHSKFLPEALALFTSEAAAASGVHYVDRVSARLNDTISAYGNPTQPDFLASSYAFTYPPYPSQQATAAWASAPTDPSSSCALWITHGGPLGHLDWIPIPPLRGCEVQARAVARARPVLAVFGHFHSSHGVEVVTWKPGVDEAARTDSLVKDGAPCLLDFTTGDARFDRGEKTIFVNAAWMTLKKRQTEERYQPVVLDLPSRLLM
ncbi:Metallo-dependent phosphatase-like protein [Emericellopsis atlantica]|uniref:Metallo-dependent phosphatase-like protein n=1 Tax=Emericellopsis atlantica TaxID=2614577 RepID=A0A9P8CPH3_9HYPO|nr:Metallo-dependent phosphatase-like protein [Emericellopsis atlantica]KAG9254533.1 Metallo-dependent phosphatase-like protein [Emericellopsis atlantica]